MTHFKQVYGIFWIKDGILPQTGSNRVFMRLKLILDLKLRYSLTPIITSFLYYLQDNLGNKKAPAADKFSKFYRKFDFVRIPNSPRLRTLWILLNKILQFLISGLKQECFSPATHKFSLNFYANFSKAGFFCFLNCIIMSFKNFNNLIIEIFIFKFI